MTLYALIASVEVGLVFAIMALGVFLTFRILDFPDLTVDGSFPLGAAVSSILISTGYNPWLSLAMAFLAGSLAGAVTGFLNVRLKILHLLASIITMTALYSVNIRIMGRPNISLLGDATIFTPIEELLLGHMDSSYISPLVFATLVIVVIAGLHFFLATEVGLAMRATGDNPRMARAMGINTGAMTILGVALSNALVALAGGLYSQAQGSADIGMGIGTIVAGLVSVIIGEALMRHRSLLITMVSVVLGSMIYRIAIGLALSVDTGDSWYSLKASDLNLVTATLVVVFLAAPKLKSLRGAK